MWVIFFVAVHIIVAGGKIVGISAWPIWREMPYIVFCSSYSVRQISGSRIGKNKRTINLFVLWCLLNFIGSLRGSVMEVDDNGEDKTKRIRDKEEKGGFGERPLSMELRYKKGCLGEIIVVGNKINAPRRIQENFCEEKRPQCLLCTTRYALVPIFL